MKKFKDGLAYLKTRLGERSTKLGIALAIGLLGKQIGTDQLDIYIEVTTTLITLLLVVLPDGTTEVSDQAKLGREPVE